MSFSVPCFTRGQEEEPVKHLTLTFSFLSKCHLVMEEITFHQLGKQITTNLRSLNKI